MMVLSLNPLFGNIDPVSKTYTEFLGDLHRALVKLPLQMWATSFGNSHIKLVQIPDTYCIKSR